MNMQRYLNKLRWYLSIVLCLLLAGCFGPDKAAMFTGTYDNRDSADKLIFADQKVEIVSDGHSLVAPFTIEDDMITIEIKRHSQEKRPDIVMRIHGEGDILTCSACAIYNLSNVWTSVESQP